MTVTGTAWLDHQWGNWTPGQGGWEWYSLQLSNNTQYMLYFIRDVNMSLHALEMEIGFTPESGD